MDEPTSAITETEVEHLFQHHPRPAREGVGIVYITHKMNEMFRDRGRLTVFRTASISPRWPRRT